MNLQNESPVVMNLEETTIKQKREAPPQFSPELGFKSCG
jgi:hypothetical protein